MVYLGKLAYTTLTSFAVEVYGFTPIVAINCISLDVLSVGAFGIASGIP